MNWDAPQDPPSLDTDEPQCPLCCGEKYLSRDERLMCCETCIEEYDAARADMARDRAIDDDVAYEREERVAS